MFEAMNDDLSWLPPSEQALARQVAPIAKAIRQFIEDAEAGNATGLPFQQRIALVAQTVTRELEISKRIRVIAATRMTSHGISRPNVVFTGSVALPAMRVAGYGSVTTTFPELPADHSAEARKQVISWQLFLFALITLIAFAAPVVVLTSDLPPDVQAAILAYDGIIAAYAAAYTFSDRGKRK
jgi:hypothetical protein